ncbi:hypothetical protein KAJ41_00245 [Candidatus Parcubacteria bacterium]|nr:hypothetical protein [Candidatus Parcubacteria bacterium]
MKKDKGFIGPISASLIVGNPDTIEGIIIKSGNERFENYWIGELARRIRKHKPLSSSIRRIGCREYLLLTADSVRLQLVMEKGDLERLSGILGRINKMRKFEVELEDGPGPYHLKIIFDSRLLCGNQDNRMANKVQKTFALNLRPTQPKSPKKLKQWVEYFG